MVSFGSVINLDSAVFNSGAPAYTITLDVSNLILNGAGFVNNSRFVQSVIIPEQDGLVGGLILFNNASAGVMTTYSGGFFDFEDFSSAGSATFDVSSDSLQASMYFRDSSTAGDAIVNASDFSVVTFYDSATGGNATLNLSSAAFASFASSNNAEHMTGNCIGGDQVFNSQIDFEGFSSAGEGTFTTIGGSTSGEQGAFILFDNNATADNATFTINGAMGAGLTTTELFFTDTTTAAKANITANGGMDGSEGGVIFFQKTSRGGTCSITLNGNAELDISTHRAPGVTIGSLTGEGLVLLGPNTLTIGSNNQSTAFSGLIQGDGGVTKTGTGRLTLTGANTYTGNTAVSGGVLQPNNRTGSATGTGAVDVSTGTLAGKGVVSGAVTIGTGSGSGAVLAPSFAAKQPGTLTCKNTVTFKADSTYNCQLNTRKARADQVSAKGITIETGAQFSLVVVGNKRLALGTVFTVANNTSPTPISGTFSNLPDGSILTLGRSKLAVSYAGGDGNDLTLTVIH